MVVALALALTPACSDDPKPATSAAPTTTATGPTCTTDLDCAQALTLGKWRKGDPLAACAEPFCNANAASGKRCDLRVRPAGSACEDNDGIPCTSGTCTAGGTCDLGVTAKRIEKDQCLIAGTCYPATTSDPATADDAKCRLCNPAQSQTAWSPRPAGSPCPDDKFGCTPDVCDAKGNCTHAIPADNCAFDGQCWKKGTLKEKEECVGCNPATSQTGWSNMGGDTSCKDDGKPCTDDKCDGKGACNHPASAAGTACSESDGKDCTVEQCDGKGVCGHDKVAPDSCHIDGACYQGGTVNPKNQCQKCAPGTKQDDWSPASAGVTCTGDALECTDETCDGAGKCGDPKVKGNTCLIEDKDGKPQCFVANMPIKGDEPCIVCDPGNTKTAATTLSDNTSCEAGAKCLLGKCKKGLCESQGPKPGFCYIAANGFCAEKGLDSPQNPCLVCDPDKDKGGWVPAAKDTACTDDKTACTVDACDGAGTCLHTKTVDKCGAIGACEYWTCEPVLNCKALPKDPTVTCEGADNVACTVETCNGKGACDPAGVATNTLCDDKVACTVDVCDAKLGCVFKPEATKCSDGNECTEDVCDGKSGCKNPSLANGGKCADDGLACTSNTCQAGTCKAAPVDDSWCIIDNKCVAGSTEADGGCKFCAPGFDVYKWSLLAPGANCDDDKVACTEDKCDDKVVCQHKPVAAACDDGLACTVDECDGVKGCIFTDNCPWGHECDAAEKVCLTTGKTPLEVVKADATVNPAPTNPAIAVHDIAPGGKTGQRLWVLWQSDTVAQAEAGAWVIKNPKPGQGVGIFALPLDPQKAAPGAKVKPEAVALPQAAFFGGSKTVLQGFPVVAADPVSKEQVWVGWLEADPANPDAGKQCLAGGGQGGVLRVARLDGKTGKGKVEVAGEVCTKAAGANGPLLLSTPIAVLDGTSANIADVAKRPLLLARPKGAGLAQPDWTTTLLVGQGAVVGAIGMTDTSSGPDVASAVRTALLDLGPKAPPNSRFLALTVGKKSGEMGLFPLPIGADGKAGTFAPWAADAPVKDLFKAFTEVCGVDAAVDASGNLGVVVVARGGGQDIVSLLTRDGAGTVKATQVNPPTTATGDCRYGYAAARVTSFGSKWLVTAADFGSSESKAKLRYWQATTSAAGIVTEVASPLVATAGATADSPAAALAWRGLGGAASLGATAAILFESTTLGAPPPAKGVHVVVFKQ